MGAGTPYAISPQKEFARFISGAIRNSQGGGMMPHHEAPSRTVLANLFHAMLASLSPLLNSDLEDFPFLLYYARGADELLGHLDRLGGSL